MKCPCGGKLITKDSRHGHMNTTRRTKKCLSCGQRIITYEYQGEYPSNHARNVSPVLREAYRMNVWGMS